MIKVIIFDMDGVIFDTIPFARESFLKSYPGVNEETYYQIHTGNFHEEVKKLEHLKIQETDEARIKRHAEYSEKKSQSKVFEGIENILKEFHSSGIILVLNTNAFRQNTLPLLERSGIKSLFDFVADAELSKSKVEKFKLIEEKYKIGKQEMLFVTDSLGDVRDADIAQVPTVAVTWGVHNESYFRKESHSNLREILNSPMELKKFIDNMNSR